MSLQDFVDQSKIYHPSGDRQLSFDLPPIKGIGPDFSNPVVKSDGGPTSYYELPPGASELLDLIEFKNMNFNIGNIFKACYRLGEKHGIDVEYDLKKIIFSAQRELERVRKLKNV